MSVVVRSSWCLGVLALVLLVAPAVAENEQLQQAAELLNRQEYRAAQEVLLQIDRASLTEAERIQLDDLLQRVAAARLAAEKVNQDLADADAAYGAGDWAAAERLYNAVVGSANAPAGAREHATLQLERIAEKRRLAEAAQPSGTVEAPPAESLPPAVEPQAPPVAPEEMTALPPAEGPRRLTPADELRMRDELLWQRAVAVAEAHANDARAAIAAGDFATARQDVAAALQAIEAAANYAEPVTKYQAARQGVLDLQAELNQAEEAAAQASAARQRAAIAEAVEQRRRMIEEQRVEKVLQLFSTVEQLKRERRYGEAAEVLREILRIDPSNVRATYELNWAEDLESFDEQARWQNDMNVQTRNALVNSAEALIPWDVDVLYPRNWLELTARRKALGSGTGGNLEDAELNRQLETTLPEIGFEETPFEQVMQFLADMTKVNLSVDWTDLVDNGIEREAPVSVQLEKVSFRTVLNEVLSQVGGDVQLAFAVGDGLLRIATKEKLDRDKLILIYDIRDLLISLPRATRQGAFDVTQGMGQGGGQGGGGGGGGGSGMFGQNQGQNQQGQGQDQYGAGNQDLVEQILDIIRQTVEPDSWRETGGGDASIRELNGQLIVYNTSDAHRQVNNLLGQLRETRALQISVETRFLDVTSNFLEQFGVDLDFVFNSGNAGYDQGQGAQGVITDPATGAIVLVPRQYSQIGVYPSVPDFGQPLTPGQVPVQPYSQAGFVPQGSASNYWTPITMQQGSLTLSQPTIGTGVPGSFGSAAGLTPALNIAGSFLDNLQVDFLIRATQANSRSSVVQAPRLVLFNGQASSISVGRSRTYVASLEPRLAEGAVGFAPETAQADSGVYMFVEGTISADRRYVTLSLFVQQRSEPVFERFEVQRASGNSPGAFIMLPDQSFAILETTVSIPDGGTVLLGGVKQAGEVEVQAGVPVLSKIPVLKRAFTNETVVKDIRTLLILVKSKIIIQSEAEDEAFPTFTPPTGA